jgi:hypothetical protein
VKIFWTDDEVDTIAQQVALLRLDSNYLNSTLTQLVAAARQVLPEDRRRPLASYGQVAKDFEGRVAAHLKNLMNRPPEVKIVEREVPKVEYVETDPADAMCEVTAGTLLDELLRRLEALLMSFIQGKGNGRPVEIRIDRMASAFGLSRDQIELQLIRLRRDGLITYRKRPDLWMVYEVQPLAVPLRTSHGGRGR